MDSTGFRLGRAREYIEYCHRLRRRKKWIKLHIVTDGKRVVRLTITKNSIGDSPAFREMSNTLKNKLKDVNVLIADSACDSRENFNLTANCGAKPLIKVRKNSTTLAKGSSFRRMAVIEQRDMLWSKKSGYSKRWLVESFFSPPTNYFLDETFFSKEGS